MAAAVDIFDVTNYGATGDGATEDTLVRRVLFFFITPRTASGIVITDADMCNFVIMLTSTFGFVVRRYGVEGGGRDGIDTDSCKDVVVEDSYFASGDDTLCVKSGIDFFGQRYNRPSRDIVFRNITTGGGYGITIGSEVSGGVENVTFEGK